ncbi:4Fe-4S dicluster domain-containing protein [Guggenheimella bovis]
MAKENLRLTQKREWCKGCGVCVAFCPTNVLVIDKDYKVTIQDIDKCIKCGQCEMRCPDYAIYLEEVEGGK